MDVLIRDRLDQNYQKINHKLWVNTPKLYESFVEIRYLSTFFGHFFNFFIRHKPIEDRAWCVPTAKQAPRHYGDEITKGSQFAMHVVYTSSCIMSIGRKAWKKMAFKRANVNQNIHYNQSQKHQSMVRFFLFAIPRFSADKQIMTDWNHF